MKETHTKEGDKALLMLNWSIGPEFKDGNKTGNMSLLLTEVYENQAGIDNHFEQAQKQLSREPYPLPQLNIKTKPDSIFDYRFEDFELINYQCHPHIPAPISI